jgi:hypothetical protein
MLINTNNSVQLFAFNDCSLVLQSELEKEYDAKLQELETTQQSLGDLQERLNGLTHEHTTLLEQCNLQQQQMEAMVRFS